MPLRTTLLSPGLSALPNQRMKLSRRGGHLWWYAQGKLSFLIVAAPARSLCAIR